MNKEIEFITIWLSVIVLTSVATFHTKIEKKFQNMIGWLVVFVFSWMYGYRTLGLDLRNYIYFWDDFSVFSFATKFQLNTLYSNTFEPVFTCWIYISKVIGLTFNQSLFIYVFIPFSIFYILINKYTKSPLVGLSVFMILFMFYFDLTRMFFALAFAMLAYVSKNKLLKVFFYFVAFSSQFTSVFLFIYEIIAGTKWLAKVSLLKMVLGCSLGLGLLKMGTHILESYNNRFFFKILYYMNEQNSYVNTSQMILLILTCSYPLFIGLYFYIKYKNSIFSLDALNSKILLTLKIGVATSIIGFSVGFRTAQRIMLPALAPLTLFLTPIVADKIFVNDGRIDLKKINILVVICFYDVLMSAYYLWIAMKF